MQDKINRDFEVCNVCSCFTIPFDKQDKERV